MSDLTDEEIIATRKLHGLDKTADEMFKEIGYKKLVGETTEVFTLSRANKNIAFSKLISRIRIYGKYDFIDIQELQAINKKCEELGWI